MLGKKQENINFPIENIHERDLLPESALFPLSGEFRAHDIQLFRAPRRSVSARISLNADVAWALKKKTRVSSETIETSGGRMKRF